MATTNKMKECGKSTRRKILEEGLKQWPFVSASSIAKALNVSHALVLYHFPDIKNSVVEYAIEKNYLPVVAILITHNHPLVRDWTIEKKLKTFRDYLKSIKVLDDL